MNPVWRILLVLALCLSVDATPAADDAKLEGQPILQITITGLKRTKVAFVLDRLASRVGQPFQAAGIEQDDERMDRMGLFSSIQIVPVQRENGVDLEIQLSEIAPFLPYPSLEYNDENGVALGGGVKFGNLLGRGISGSISARFGGQTDMEILLDSAWSPNPSPWYDVVTYYRNRLNSLDDFKENAFEGVLRAGYQFHPAFRLGGQFDYMSMQSDTPEATLSPSNRDWTPGLGVVAEYDTRDFVSNPRRGWRNSVDFTKYGGFLSGDGDFARVNFDVRRFHPIGDRHSVALFSLTTLQSGTVGEEIPVYRDFHIGGANTIRGWDIGAREGKNQMINTLEYRYDVLKIRSFRVFGIGLYAGVQVAAFGDLGTAWNDSDDFTRNFIGGGGFGVRLLFPYVRVIRLDFGFGQSGMGISPHFGIREKAYNQRFRVR